MSVRAFYDELAPLYHLVYKDWEATVARQGGELASLMAGYWGASVHAVLDAALGIGTQALGLLARGFRVTGSDLSLGAVARARREAIVRSLPLVSLVADFRALPVRSGPSTSCSSATTPFPILTARRRSKGPLPSASAACVEVVAA